MKCPENKIQGPQTLSGCGYRRYYSAYTSYTRNSDTVMAECIIYLDYSLQPYLCPIASCQEHVRRFEVTMHRVPRVQKGHPFRDILSQAVSKVVVEGTVRLV